MASVIVDTRIWVLALKTPYLADHDSALQMATRAQRFLRGLLLNDHRLLISGQLAAEIFHVLTGEGNKIPADQARRFLSDILERKNTIFRPLTSDMLMRAMHLSTASGIHLSDYLSVLPFEDVVDAIYTMDPHYQHPTLMNLAKVENPLEIWRSEDQEL